MSGPHTASGVKPTLPKRGLRGPGGRFLCSPLPGHSASHSYCSPLSSDTMPVTVLCLLQRSPSLLLFLLIAHLQLNSNHALRSCSGPFLQTILSNPSNRAPVILLPFPHAAHVSALHRLMTDTGVCLPHRARSLIASKCGPLSPACSNTSHQKGAQYLPNRTELLIYTNCYQKGYFVHKKCMALRVSLCPRLRWE